MHRTSTSAPARTDASPNWPRLVGKVVGYGGRIVFDASKPDGTPRKLLDVSRLRKLGWSATTTLADGLGSAYRAYLATQAAR